MTKRLIVTAALPYANGSLHLGHLVEYCPTDMYVRALRRLGVEAHYICADDAHGTPIEMNAARLGIAPEALVTRYYHEHQKDFETFDVRFDHFGITHSDENRMVVEHVYRTLSKHGLLEERDIDGNWCDKDQRFLPDRFIRGICPRCGAKDQYGDVCESCGATYSPTDLKEPRCALCGSTPTVRPSKHIFFKLSSPDNVTMLRAFIDSGALQNDVANYVRNWLDTGLRDWCISRDGPYFGFAIPDRPGKYFYVWLDAPLGYVASSLQWAKNNRLSLEELWQAPEQTRIEHVIGKDIVYFHTLFWPAVLHAMGYTLPSKVHVHGMLTIDGEKMSKSRGTFIKAADFAKYVEPQALRYYYACKASSQSDDLDLSFDDFIGRVNGELVNKHANLFSRVMQFLERRLDGKTGPLPFTSEEAQQEPQGDGSMLDLARRVVAHCRLVEEYYRQREFAHATRELAAVADIANEFVQTQKPWDQIKDDVEAARLTCSFAANICYALAMYLWPIVPRFSEACSRVMAVEIEHIDSLRLFRLGTHTIGTMERLFERIDKAAIEQLVEASKQPQAATSTPAQAQAPEPVAPLKDGITYDDFARVDLRVGVVVAAESIKKSKKLLCLKVDLGEGQPRQIVAGIAQAYNPEQLVGKRVVVVANLAPTSIMGVESRGMILAAGEAPSLELVGVPSAQPGAGIR